MTTDVVVGDCVEVMAQLPLFVVAASITEGRVCRDCREMKPVSAFKVHSQSPNFAYPRCKSCERRHHELIAIQDYGQLVMDQGGEFCRICGRAGNGRRLHIDIDHATERVRGLLCFNCNSGLGKFYDNPRLLLRAADYLLNPSYSLEAVA